jgi:hypothetical protein
MVLEVFYEVITRFLEDVGRHSQIFVRTSQGFRRGLEGFRSVFKYTDIPQRAANLYLYLLMEDTQKVEW